MGRDPAHRSTALPPDDEAELFRSVAAGAASAVIAADTNGRILWVNDAATRTFGRTRTELVGRPVTVLLPEHARAELDEVRKRLLAEEEPGALITSGLRRDGQAFPLALTPAARRDAQGRLVGMLLTARDITQDVRIRRELTEALARSHARFDQVAQPQALLDLESRFVAVNDAACALLGTTRDRLLGRDSRDFIRAVDTADAGSKVADLVAGRVRATSYEGVAVRPDDAEVPVLLDLSAVHDPDADDGRPRELVVFARDLTDLQEAHRRLEAQSEFYRALYRRASDPACVIDAEGRLLYISPAYTRVFGPQRLAGLGGFESVHPDDLAATEQMVARAVGLPDVTQQITVRARDLSGRWRWFDARVTNCLDDPAIGGLVVNFRERTAEVEAVERLRASEARYRAIVETAQEGILALDPDGNVLFANDKLAELFGVRLDDLYTGGFLRLLDDEERRRTVERLNRGDQAGAEHHETTIHAPDGSERVLSVAAGPLLDDEGAVLGSLSMVADVTAERQAVAELRHQAMHDALTGLPNRALLVDRLTMAAARQARVEAEDGSITGEGRGVAVLFLDLDHFKLVNDSRGHEVGDRVLVEVAARIEQAVRQTDTVARLGGDEFAIVCEDSTREDADLVAGRVQQLLSAPIDVDGEHLYMSASIGIALSPPHSVTDLLRFADAAMYVSKDSGRSQVTTFDGTDSTDSQRRLAIAAGLREALAAESLTCGYQPIVDLDTARVLGLEALLRWTHPRLGPVPPEEVVSVADTTGLSFELDRAVILRSARDLMAMREAGRVPGSAFVSVNVSPRTAQQHRLDGLVREVLDETGLPASCLCLEITEHALMDNADHAVALLTRLTESGVRVAIDDFGTGYNSLVHLQRLPVRTLKIDRSFVAELSSRSESVAIARSIVGLAQALGLDVVAEGVEDDRQLEVLRGLGCQAGQGYLWSPAAPRDELPGSADGGVAV